MIFVNDFSPEIVNLGHVGIRWYGLLFAVGIVLSYLIIRWAFIRNRYSVDKLDSVAVYLFFGLVIGARLGHVLFYNFEYFWKNPIEILKIWNGGLASHGAAVGVFLAYVIWCKVHKVKFVKYTDALVLGFPIAAMFVRIGNFFNSEIVGIKTNGNFGVVFKRLGENFPRHPAQLYEAVLSFVIFLIMFFIFKKYYKKTPPLFFMFLYILLYFSGRFVIEFWKDLHVLPANFPLSMGQVLSLLPILLAIGYFTIFFPKLKKRKG